MKTFCAFYPVVLIALVQLSYEAESYEAESYEAGQLCSNSTDCDSRLLFCSKSGVCLCNTTIANLMYDYNYDSYLDYSVFKPRCELQECNPHLLVGLNGCDIIRGCHRHPTFSNVSYCRCPVDEVGFRSLGYQTCNPVTYVGLDGRFSIDLDTVCDFKRKFRSKERADCVCYKNHIYDKINDTCIERQVFLDKYGVDKLGLHKGYCENSSDCQGTMLCKSFKCECPKGCRGTLAYAKDVCYCDLSTNGLYDEYCGADFDCQSEMKCTDWRCICPAFCPTEYLLEGDICYCKRKFNFLTNVLLPVLCISFVIGGILLFLHCRQKLKIESEIRNGLRPIDPNLHIRSSSNIENMEMNIRNDPTDGSVGENTILNSTTSNTNSGKPPDYDGLPTYHEATAPPYSSSEININHHYAGKL